MRLTAVRELTVALEGNVANALVSFADHTVSLVALCCDQRRDGRELVGYGFNSIGRYGQAGILRERMIPRLLAADPQSLLSDDGTRFDPAQIAAVALRNEKPGGHGDRAGAVGALELAAWDLNAKLGDEPAWVAIARHFGSLMEPAGMPVYAAGGYYYPGDSLSRLRGELESYRALGFDAFKMKIGGAPLARDMERIETALAVAGDGSRLAVDANGRFNVSEALAYADAMQAFELRWFEEPGDPLDYELNRAVVEGYDGAIATGENLFSARDALNLIRYGGMRPELDVFQMDPGISYGLTEYGHILEDLESHGFSRAQCFPHGGHLINLHVAVGLGLGGCEAYPDVFRPFGGYAPQCRVEDGRVWPSDAPGFGLEQKPELRQHLKLVQKE